MSPAVAESSAAGPPSGRGIAAGPGDLLALQRLAGNLAVRAALRLPTPVGPAAALRDAVRRNDASLDGPVLQRVVLDRPETHPVLRFGSSDPEVEHLQERLNEEGVAEPPLEVDSEYGPLTTAAVREFQARHGLAVDGVVGIRTWGLIDELERRGIAGPTATTLDQTMPVDTATHAAVEAILHPSSSGGVGGPAMTDTGPGGAYETEVITALDALAAEVIARPVATPAVDMNHANRVSARAQEEVETVFGSEITLASRRPDGSWHPGSSRMGLADATTRVSSAQDILAWADYFMDNGSYEPAQVAQTHHYDGTRATPDKREHDRVRNLWLARGGRSKVDQMVRSWPAEASTGTVFLQLRDPAYQDRTGMWDLFATMVHEFLHLVTHPNYSAVADAEGGGAADILAEGMDEHFKNEVWNAVRGRIASDVPFRTEVEGPFAAPVVNTADYDAGSQIDNQVLDNHYASLAQAEQIVSEVGEANARAAFFMGHVEALGIGAGSRSEHSLAGLASWTPDMVAPDHYVVPAGGETVAQIRQRTGSTHIEDTAGLVWVEATHTFAAGEQLRVPGVRWHTAIAEDTRAQVANQHGVSQEALEDANRLPPARGTTRVPPGTVLLIPVHP
jgi:peptidoglycan hydrolase-like protein with peptidoglycan-binding domain